MNLTEEQAKEVVVKVFEDLDLYCSTKYPTQAFFIDKGAESNELGISHWTGGYNYQNPEAAGDDFFGEYPEYYVIVDDKKGEAVMYGYYTGHYYIELKNGKYVQIGKTTETKRPW